MIDVGSLSVVIPVFNEAEWIARCIDALRRSATVARWPLRIVVVDDGSTDGTARTLTERADPTDLTVVRQDNAGRFAARRAGLLASTGDYVLLLDSRVELDDRALTRLRAHLGDNPETVWNAHVETVSDGKPWSAFWSGLTKIWWRQYHAHPRPVSFGLAEFDRYPKGTGAFAAPRALLLAASDGFESLYADQRYASDDTRVLRAVAETHPINIDPDFSCRYHGKGSGPKWVRQCWFRGTTFVDGYVPNAARARRLLVLGAVSTLVGGGLVARYPRPAIAASMTSSLAVGLFARRCGARPGEAAAVTGLLPAFAVLFGAGVARGLAMAVRSARA